MSSAAPFWQVSPTRRLALDQPRIMGILNITPDSFSDGGQHVNLDDAVSAAMRMHDEGACLIDIGGESTRPGATSVSDNEQMRRTLPVIQLIRSKMNSEELLISIDTTRSRVARAALDAGADIINDISAGRDDHEMLPLAASRGCGIVLMHRLKPPSEDSFSTDYSQSPNYHGDVMGVVREFLKARCRIAIAAGIAKETMVIDPGLGFGKSVDQNYQLAGRISELAELAFPVLSAASRKSFLGAASGVQTPAQRVYETVAMSVFHYLAGVRLFRVHDVAAHGQALSVARRIVDRAKPQAATVPMES